MARQHCARTSKIAGGGPRGANSERSIFDLNSDVDSLPNQFRRKASQTIADFEGDAGFRRREGMYDGGLGVSDSQFVQDCLVHNFSGQTNISGRNLVDRTHEAAPPVRWRARDMS